MYAYPQIAVRVSRNSIEFLVAWFWCWAYFATGNLCLPQSVSFSYWSYLLSSAWQRCDWKTDNSLIY